MAHAGFKRVAHERWIGGANGGGKVESPATLCGPGLHDGLEEELSVAVAVGGDENGGGVARGGGPLDGALHVEEQGAVERREQVRGRAQDEIDGPGVLGERLRGGIVQAGGDEWVHLAQKLV